MKLRICHLLAIAALALVCLASVPTLAQNAYITNSSGRVSVIDTETDAVIGDPITVGSLPQGLSVSPDGSKVYVANGISATVSVIETSTNTVTATIPVGADPGYVAVSPDGRKVYVTNFDSDIVSVIDAATNAVTNTITVGTQSTGVAITPDGSKVYVANYGSGKVWVIDAASNAVIGSPIPVGAQPFGVAVSPDGSSVYVANSSPGTVSVIATATNAVIGDPIRVGTRPVGVAVTPDGSKVYVGNSSSGTVSVIDTATNTVIGDPITVGNFPEGVAVTPDGSKVYVANYGLPYSVSVIATATNAVTTIADPNFFQPLALGMFIQPQKCKPLDKLNTIAQSPNITAKFTISGQMATYSLDTPNYGPIGGLPGVIEYCVYPSQPPGNPDVAPPGTAALYNGWVTEFGKVQGYFAFKRPSGPPTNIPFDGTTGITVGQATWTAPGGAPRDQKIVLRINNPAECNELYRDGSTTCLVIPQTPLPPPVSGCPNNEIACETVEITPLQDETIPLTVPAQKKLTITYTYIIHNTDPTRHMVFLAPNPQTKDINNGGGKDNFGCEQTPMSPDAFGLYPNYQLQGFDLNLTAGSGGGCQQSRLTLVAGSRGKPQVLAPDEVKKFTVTMTTRQNKNGKYEYAVGCHVLTSGFTLKWYWGTSSGAPTSTLQSNSTNRVAITVDAILSDADKTVCLPTANP